MTEKYTVENGKWGAYFRDNVGEYDLTLADVAYTLNNDEHIKDKAIEHVLKELHDDIINRIKNGAMVSDLVMIRDKIFDMIEGLEL